LTVSTGSLLQYFRQSSLIEKSAQFSLDQLAKAYLESKFKLSISRVTISNNLQRFINLEGTAPESFSFSLKNGKLNLRIWDNDFEIQSITHRNGIQIFLDSHSILLFSPQNLNQIFSEACSFILPQEMNDNDSVLLLRIMNGDLNALGEYLIKNRRKFESKAQHKGLTLSEAEDMFQIATIKAIEALPEKIKGTSFKTEDKLAAWIEIIIKNSIIDALRRRNQRSKMFFNSDTVISDDDSFDFLNQFPEIDFKGNPRHGLDTEELNALTYLLQLKSLVDENPRSPVRHLLGYAIASLQDEELTQAQYATSINMSESDLKTYSIKSKKALNRIWFMFKKFKIWTIYCLPNLRRLYS